MKMENYILTLMNFMMMIDCSNHQDGMGTVITGIGTLFFFLTARYLEKHEGEN